MRGLPGKVVFIAALAFAAACSSTDGPDRSSIDLNAAISQSTTGDFATLPGAATVFGVPSATLTSPFDAGACPFAQPSQSFVCPPKTSNGLTYSLSYMLLDAGGQNLSSPDPATMSAVRALFDVNGTTTNAAVHHHSDLTMSGLLGTLRTLNGTSSDRDTIASSAGSLTTRSVITASSTTTNLVLPSGSSKFPMSGTITADIATSTSVGSGPSATSTAHAIVTFNGTNIATVILTFAGSTRTCQIDLTGGIPHCSGA